MLVLFPPLTLLNVKGDGKNLFVFWKQEDLLEQMQLLFIIFLTGERQLTEINIHFLPLNITALSDTNVMRTKMIVKIKMSHKFKE